MFAGPSPHNPRYLALLELLRAADTLWNASRVFFDRWQLSPSQFNVLNLLHGHAEGLSQTELSRQLIMHRSNVTGLVDRLERRGLVTRQEVVSDRRAYRVVLTPDGLAILEQIFPAYFENAARVWGELPTRRIAELVADLRKVSTNAKEIADHLS